MGNASLCYRPLAGVGPTAKTPQKGPALWAARRRPSCGQKISTTFTKRPGKRWLALRVTISLPRMAR